MDWTEVRKKLPYWMKNQRYLLLILLLGMLLMSLPGPDTSEEPEVQTAGAEEPALSESLEKLLSQMSGAGKVRVLLTQAEGEETVYQLDEDISAEDIRRDTVMVTGSDREETGLIRKTNPPVYRGAVILCQGADDAAVRLAIVQAVMSVTGLRSDRITVLKMK